MKYKVGDIVKLSTGDKGIITRMFRDNVNEVFRYSATIEDDDYDEYNLDEKEIVGLWKECKSTEQVSKSEDSSVNSSVKKYKLIDILNKIANGELKEGTRVKVRDNTYEFTKQYRTDIVPDLVREDYEGERISIFEDFYLTSLLNDEVELIEPNHSPDVGKMAEPTDNTKIEELDKEEMLCLTLQCAIAVLTDKLNDVIRKLNKENNNE